MATATVIIPTIQACAERSLESRIAAIKKFFGLPRWVLRNQPAAQSAPFSITPSLDLSKPFAEPKQFSVVTSGLPKSPTKFLQDVTAPTKRDRNLIALMEVTKLSKGQKPTTKDHIFKYVETCGVLGVTAENIGTYLSTVPYKSVTSRISEMVKEGTLVVSRKSRNRAGTEVSVYTLPKAGK